MSIEMAPNPSPAPASTRGLFTGYTLLFVGAIVLFFLVRSVGETMTGPAPATTAPAAAAAKGGGGHGILPQVLIAITVVVTTSRFVGSIAKRLGQPRVIGEVLAGIILGPSLLGRIAPGTMTTLFPATIMPTLNTLAQIGVILYMFLVGLDLNAGVLRSRAHATVAISHVSIIVPFLLGATLALWLFPTLAPAGISFTSFALFLGAAMAITAFPVLARILTDQKMEKSELGVLSLGCAAVDDVTAWCLLAFVVGVTKAELGIAVTTIVLAVGYVAVMLLVARPLANKWFGSEAGRPLTTDLTALLLVGVLVSSLITEAIGIHAIFGAFLLGAVIPHESEVAKAFRHRLEDVVTILLLPLFFAYTGMRTQIGLLSTPMDWIMCAVIILVATLGKFGGTVAAGRWTGLDWRTSSALGVMMNTRGLMELIVLNIGLDMGVISPTLFAMMVLMAIVTTIATTPILTRLVPPQELAPSS
ncbi:cation:proton antiporter [Planctomyces sp. SH-PL14]|uniref:cation:proton antiporter domain-containing protein n=1 Tax=Planctomyces sp. SH-PL14 TaxID=1632864 RepID=UPI00078E8C47|nr:cation:proton antiporter [Planctomyces sp. SH-PL14]AMV17791.1 High-affinity Na(+)/H(+) antiporter NhaS3 [Planctomyces sp. SH-PL14]